MAGTFSLFDARSLWVEDDIRSSNLDQDPGTHPCLAGRNRALLANLWQLRLTEAEEGAREKLCAFVEMRPQRDEMRNRRAVEKSRPAVMRPA
jgi:hypothetical protein